MTAPLGPTGSPAFVDTNVIAYAAFPDERGRRCADVLRAVGEGHLDGRTSTAVLEELLHLELRGRPPGLGGITARAYALFTPLLPVTDAVFRRALDLEAPRLGANDRIHVAVCRAVGVDVIVTADAAFDAVGGLHRVDPLDAASVAALLGRRSSATGAARP